MLAAMRGNTPLAMLKPVAGIVVRLRSICVGNTRASEWIGSWVPHHPRLLPLARLRPHRPGDRRHHPPPPHIKAFGLRRTGHLIVVAMEDTARLADWVQRLTKAGVWSHLK